MIKSILVPVDGSAPSERAVGLAADLAAPSRARLTILHVMTEIGSFRVPPELRELARLEHVDVTEHDLLGGRAQSLVQEGAKRARDKGATAVETAVEIGRPAETILDLAASRGVDLIVMGSRGMGELKGLLLGSVSHTVSHLARCPCTIVK